MSDFAQAFFIVPSRIINLPGITLTFIRFYETIFQFWNHGKDCYLSNSMIKERTGIKSDSTIKECFSYFEKHEELKRVDKGNRRFIVQTARSIEHKESVDKTNEGLAVARGGSRCSEGEGLAVARHNNNNINNKEINKSSYVKDQKKTNKTQEKTAGSICTPPENKTKDAQRKENAKRHAFADSMDQMASEARSIKQNEIYKKTEPPKEIKQILNCYKKPNTSEKRITITTNNFSQKVEKPTYARVPWFNEELEADYQLQKEIDDAKQARDFINGV